MTNPDEVRPADAPIEAGPVDADERDIEAPDADAQDLSSPADPTVDGPQWLVRVEPEVNEYDALEQARAVELDDEYR